VTGGGGPGSDLAPLPRRRSSWFPTAASPRSWP